jgi:hypothetical protein
MNVSRKNILRRFDETEHRKIGKLQFEWQFIASNHTYYMYCTLSYYRYSDEFISICFFHWTHNHYITSFFLKPWIPYVGWMVILTTGPAGNLSGPQTPCITRNDTLVSALSGLSLLSNYREKSYSFFMFLTLFQQITYILFYLKLRKSFSCFNFHYVHILLFFFYEEIYLMSKIYCVFFKWRNSLTSQIYWLSVEILSI